MVYLRLYGCGGNGSSAWVAVRIIFLYNEHMEIQDLKKTQPWIVAVSGGSDSMALLHMCIAYELPVVAAHMNYQKRASAQRDMNGVRSFCAKYHIPLEIRMQEEECTGNFQAFAREKRYLFFGELIEKYNAAGVLVAHQLDDHLETYLMQKEKGAVAETFGLSTDTEIYGCRVIRPLLHHTKAQLEAYCRQHDVPYWVDESNMSDVYTRNRIRHTRIDPLSMTEKYQIEEEIKKCNERHDRLKDAARRFLQEWQYDCVSLCERNDDEQFYILYRWLHESCGVTPSKKMIQTLRIWIAQGGNGNRPCSDTYMVRKEYGMLHLIKIKGESYAYTLTNFQYLETPYFRLSDHGEIIEGVTVTEADFPLTIRNVHAGDAISLRFGTKKVARWLIDRKIPLEQRRIWPVMVNASGKIIFVSKIGCDIAHFSNNPNVFVLK